MKSMNKETRIGLILIVLLLVLTYVGNLPAEQVVLAQETKEVVQTTSTPTQQPKSITVSHSSDLSEVEEYIWEVFGDYTPKAMLLLKGQGAGTCAENRNLDPKAVNDNRTWGGVGRDVSIFQVNDVYHPVKELNLENDWKANVRYAYRMFQNDNYSFKRWTCGRVWGI